ncbi:hypothetical protein Pelo_11807 [Pelomyxa schiedti]|nr:hypothetical protein Pelo_11807 [Pelomyxa schiedti]
MDLPLLQSPFDITGQTCDDPEVLYEYCDVLAAAVNDFTTGQLSIEEISRIASALDELAQEQKIARTAMPVDSNKLHGFIAKASEAKTKIKEALMNYVGSIKPPSNPTSGVAAPSLHTHLSPESAQNVKSALVSVMKIANALPFVAYEVAKRTGLGENVAMSALVIATVGDCFIPTVFSLGVIVTSTIVRPMAPVEALRDAIATLSTNFNKVVQPPASNNS